MNKLQLTFEVARWEFTRFYKIRNELKGAFYMLLIGAFVFGLGWFVSQDTEEKPVLAVLNEYELALDALLAEQFELRPIAAEETDSILASIGAQEIDGLFIVESIDRGKLIVHSERMWTKTLEDQMTEIRRSTWIERSGLPGDIVESLLAPFTVETEIHEAGVRSTTAVEKILAGACVVFMLWGVFIGFAYQFTSITGEKQQRMTEQIVSAISPQTWIDGKILGITGVGLANIGFSGGRCSQQLCCSPGRLGSSEERPERFLH